MFIYNYVYISIIITIIYSYIYFNITNINLRLCIITKVLIKNVNLFDTID